LDAIKALAAKFEEASVRYAKINQIERNDEWFVLKLQEELGEMTQAWMKQSGRGRPNGRTPEDLARAVEDECADLLGHVLLFAHRNGLDLAAAIARKWRFDPSTE
jgi:NTP pyrophosphatase (non-canonical NTP hydrolase)